MSESTSSISASSNKTLMTASAAVLGLIGASTLAYSLVQSRSQKRKAQEIFLSKRAAKKNSVNVDDDIAPLLKKQPRRVTLYFDENDEMVDEKTAQNDPYNYYHKYHAVQVDFGGDEGFELASHKITKDIFWGEKCTDNAQIFIENLQKSKAKHQKQMFEQELFNQSLSESDDLNIKAINDLKDSNPGDASVIMDINPNKFEKPKDNLFFDFFSLYAKKFIDQKQSKAQKQNSSNAIAN